MGCTSSSESAAVNEKYTPTHDTNERKREKKREKTITAGTETMAISTHARIDTVTTTDKTPPPTKTGSETTTSTKASAAVVGNCTIRYACLSKKGRDPDDASKPNQDCYGVHETFCNGNSNSDAAFFGVYDGHGPHGEASSQFVQQRLPDLVKKNIIKNQNDTFSIDQVHASLHKAHTECNDELRLSQINDSYSGTTSITLYIHESRITVCNVGDSRALLGTKPKTTSAGASTRLQAVPLSTDQTPYRSDEAARCVLSGARILSFGQIDPSSKDDDDSEIEDPPRVWAQKGKYPGTAFTRSIGDAVAEELGVFAEPEMLTLKLSQYEKLIVLASDGIFDVMSNQEVIDLCFQHKDDPTQACNAVIEKSHEEWLLNEECVDEESASYDDMTIICIFVDDVGDESVGDSDSAAAAASKDDVQLPSSTPQPRHHTKRVRQKTLRNLEEM